MSLKLFTKIRKKLKLMLLEPNPTSNPFKCKMETLICRLSLIILILIFVIIKILFHSL